MRFVTLRVWHPDCWMLEMCDAHRDLSIESRGVSCHRGTVHADAVVRSADQSAIMTALAETAPADVHREVLHVGRGFAEVYSNYPAYRSVYETTVNTGFLVVGPVIHQDGYERWEVLAEASQVNAGIARLRESAEVRVERVSETKSPQDARATEGLLGRLSDEMSDRQFDVLRRAVAAGYYDWPRGKNVKTLATELGVSGPTTLEHIRRAEGHIMPAIVAELARLRAQGER